MNTLLQLKQRILETPRGVIVSRLCMMLALLPPLGIVGMIYKWGVNVPFGDEWLTSIVVLHWFQGHGSYTELMAQVNEHRIFFVQLLTLGLARLTHFNFTAQMYAGVVIQLVGLFCLSRLIQRTFAQINSGLVGPLVVMASVWVFTAAQSINWVYGLPGVEFGLAFTSAIFTIWSWATWPNQWRGILVAAAGATVATFTSANGLLLWPIGAVAIGLSGWVDKRRLHWPQLGLWLVFATVEIGYYFIGYVKPLSSPNPLDSLRDPLLLGRFIATFLGAPIARCCDPTLAEVSGYILIGLAVVATIWYLRWWRAQLALVLPWFLLLLVDLLNASLTAVGRVGFGLAQAMERRYLPFSVLFFISTVVLLVLVFFLEQERLNPRWRFRIALVAGALGIVVAVGYLLSYRTGMIMIANMQIQEAEGAAYLVHYETAPDEKLTLLYPDARLVRQVAPTFQVLKLGPFADN